MSKIEKARALYNTNVGKTRLELIDLFQKELGFARGTAASYHDSIKKATNKTVAVPPAAVVMMAVAPKKEVKAKVESPKAETPKAETPKVETAKSAKRISTGSNRLLHNFTREEMLEVLDEETRKEVEALVAREEDAREQHTVQNNSKHA